ncbi:Predicted oxidoreductase [Amycolatopsis xylanica]|uniref:Predicted oxidoreductase n=1 Tax=Amycolatopsis xylanica TaxID=589385 RepID=A0A1H3L0V7_9PSEU|nr:oxidoreductase [Amycolatopsis xylanica]SDY57896.1 Predicted oxidoreductase [Amycolatopsis xylanica]
MTNAAASGTWKLGQFTVNRLGFGAMRLMFRDRDSAIAVLRRAVELGVNHIDTAAFYFHGHLSANELINAALRPYRDDLVITTKVGPGRDPSGTFLPFATPEQLKGQVEENLRQLGREHMDVVNLRLGEALERGTGSLADWFGTLAELREAGMIRELGISNVGPEHLDEALKIAPVVCVQNQYGFDTRREDDALIETCARHDIAFVPFFAVANSTENAAVDELAAKYGVTPAQIRLAWTLHKGPNVLAIPGTGDLAHLEQNIAAGSLRLAAEDLDSL